MVFDQYLHIEFEFLRKFFHNNGFQISYIDYKIKNFLANIFEPQSNIQPPVTNNKTVYFSIPYFGAQSENLKSELLTLLSKYFKDIKFHVTLVNKFTIGSIFPFKDKLPTQMRRSLVYNFRCSRCESQYVGSTTRTLGARVAEHLGRSYRTNRFITTPSHSSIREHSFECDARVSIDDFKILDSNSNPNDLRILESLYILKLKPNLNDTKSAVPLRVA